MPASSYFAPRQPPPEDATTGGGIGSPGGPGANAATYAQNPNVTYAPPDGSGVDYGNQSPGFFGTGTYQPNPGNFQIPGYAGFQNTFAQGAMAAPFRAAPQIDPSQQGQFRGQQQSLASMLMAQASGSGPSLAQGQLQQATDRNLSQAYALGAARPNNGAVLRDIANQRGAISQQAAADSGQLRLQEQMQATGQLGQLLAGARGQDLGLASDNAQLQAGQNQLNQQALQFYLSQGMSLAQAQAQANIALEQIRSGAFAQSADNQIGGKVVGGVLGAGGAFAGGYAGGLGGHH